MPALGPAVKSFRPQNAVLVSMGLFFLGEFKYEAGVLAQRSNQPLGVTQIDTAVVGHSKKMREPGF